MDYTELPILTRLAAYLNALAGNGEAPDPLVYNEYFLKGIVERLDGIGKGEKGDKGDTGAPGATIVSVEKTGTSGAEDIYTITMSDGSTFEFSVTNGAMSARVDGQKLIIS